ncbi:MAG: PilN domain-containing protein [Undibacterium sp.]|nr:PilN domain-containing protein [Undibacterium sp.]
MIKINLLPHREVKRKELRNKFYSWLVLGGIAGAAVVLLVGTIFSTQVTAQTERNTYIDKENKILEEKIKEVATLKGEIEALRARQEAVEDLQSDRNQPVFMMNELVKLAPEGLYLTEIKQEGQRISLKGYAQSHAVVGTFITEMGMSEWMSRPEIIKNTAVMLGTGRDAKRVIGFDLNVDIKRPRELEAAAASAAQEAKKKPAVVTKP